MPHLPHPPLSASENFEPLRVWAGPRSMVRDAPTSLSTPRSPTSAKLVASELRSPLQYHVSLVPAQLPPPPPPLQPTRPERRWRAANANDVQ